MRKLAAITVTVAALAVPAAALAAEYPQEGEIIDDAPTRVSLVVETNGNDPVSVAKFRAKNVFTRCDKEPSRIDFKVLDAVKVDDDNRFKSRLTDGEGGILRITGKVKDDGRATVGSVKTNDFTSDDGRVCKTPKQRFKTKA